MTESKLVFFGDSFTAGDEVLDQHYLADTSYDYPPFINHHQVQKNSKLGDPFKGRPNLEDYLRKDQILELKQNERQNSYAGLLQGDNRAVSGTSLQTMSREVVEYLENVKHRCVLFLQPSGIERWSEHVDGQWKEFIGFDWFEYDSMTKDYFKFRLANSTEFSNFISWFTTFITLIGYINQHEKIEKWCLIDNGTLMGVKSMIVEKGWNVSYISRLDLLKSKTVNFPHVDDLDFPYFCPGGHVNLEAHRRLVKRIKEKIL